MNKPVRHRRKQQNTFALRFKQFVLLVGFLTIGYGIWLGICGVYNYTADYIDRTSLHPYTYTIQPGDGLDSISEMVKDEKNGYTFKDAQNIYPNGHAIYHGALKAYDTMTVFTTKSRAAELGLTPETK